MKSSRQKTFKPLITILPATAVLIVILLLYPALFATGQLKVVRVINGDMTKWH